MRFENQEGCDEKAVVVVMLLAGLSVGVLELSAHHGRGNVYDMETPVTLNGKVTEVAWRNPHVLVYMEVENESGGVVKWAFENSSVNTLAEQGYHRKYTATRTGNHRHR